MTIDAAPSADTESATVPTEAGRAGRRLGWGLGAMTGLVLCAALTAGSAYAASAGGTARGLAGTLAAAVGAFCAWRLGAASACGTGAAPPDGRHAPVAFDSSENRQGAAVMVREVVPMWCRQLETARGTAEEGLGNLLATFSALSENLNVLSQQAVGAPALAAPGAVDDAVRSHHPALAALQAPSERAFAQRDEAVAALSACAASLNQLQQHAKQAREIARHTRLVAFNASIEAQRDRSEGGSQAIAVEIRGLAQRMAETGEHVEHLAHGLLEQVTAVHRRGAVSDTTPDELRMEIALRARDALAALLGTTATGAMGGGLQGAAESLREQIDNTFTGFQFGDRLSQMLSIVGNDMEQFTRWVAVHPHATATDAAEWLAALQASYTMDEQRSSHHGNVHVDRGSEIEFF